jgi:hypothetical protein
VEILERGEDLVGAVLGAIIDDDDLPFERKGDGAPASRISQMEFVRYERAR